MLMTSHSRKCSVELPMGEGVFAQIYHRPLQGESLAAIESSGICKAKGKLFTCHGPVRSGWNEVEGNARDAVGVALAGKLHFYEVLMHCSDADTHIVNQSFLDRQVSLYCTNGIHFYV